MLSHFVAFFCYFKSLSSC